MGTWDYVGWGIWGFGFIFEVVADMQKSSFRSNPANKVSHSFSGVLNCDPLFGSQLYIDKEMRDEGQ